MILVATPHPARYSDCLLPLLAELIGDARRVLDPFAGSGKLRQVRPDAVLVELEPEWARVGGAIVGDALALPFPGGAFDCVCTSPVYGNRMSDRFTDYQPEKHYRRNTYTHAIGRQLHPHNAGRLQWGEPYRAFHRQAWAEVWRVLAPGGRLVLNISDHIRDGKRVNVAAWHVAALEGLGFELARAYEIPTPRQRYGANGAARVEAESIFLFTKG